MAKTAEKIRALLSPVASNPVQALVLLLCAWVFASNAAAHWPRTIDDAYITLRFARNFAEGHGFVFNAGDRSVEGFTSVLWLFLCAAAIKIGMDAMFAAKLAGFACGIGTMAFAWRVSARLRGREDPLNALPCLLLAANTHFAHWAVQGLETLAQPMILVALTLRFRSECTDERRRIASPLLAVAAYLARPDSIVYGGPLFAWGVWLVFRRELRWKRLALWCTLCALGLAAVTAWRVATFGDPFPNTYYAKMGQGDVDHVRGLAHLYEFYINHGGFENGAAPLHGVAWMNLAVGSLLTVLFLGTAAQRCLVAGPVLLNAWHVWHVGGDWMESFRFLMPALPYVCIAAACVPDAWSRLAQSTSSRAASLAARALPRIALAACVAGTCIEQLRVDTAYVFHRDPLWIERKPTWLHPRQVARGFTDSYSVALGPVAETLLLRTPAGASVFMSDIGFPGWICPHLDIVDVDGLTDQYLADAPSVRKESFGGPPIPTIAEVRAKVEANAADSTPREWIDSGTAHDYRRAVAERNTRYLMLSRRPEWILAFEVHYGKGPDVPGMVYPEPVADALRHPAFADYHEVWRGVKTGGDVWNHLYARQDAAEPGKEERLARMELCARINPRMARMAELLYREMAQSGELAHEGRRRLVERAIRRFPRDENLMLGVLFHAGTVHDVEMARIAYEAAIAARPDFPEATRLMADALDGAGHHDEARALREGGGSP